jgi:hypothetical protein
MILHRGEWNGPLDMAYVATVQKYNDELSRKGILLSGEGLHPSARSKRVRFSRGAQTVIDGPFAETKELIAGFSIWQVNSMDEAVEWVKRCPMPEGVDGAILEICQVWDLEDLPSQ